MANQAVGHRALEGTPVPTNPATISVTRPSSPDDMAVPIMLSRSRSMSAGSE
jgi:hypothetical protein